MSNISLYNGREFGQVSNGIARQRHQALAVVFAQHEIADARLMAAGSLVTRGATDIINTVALCAEGVRQVPQAGAYLEPLLRSYTNTVSEIIQRGIR